MTPSGQRAPNDENPVASIGAMLACGLALAYPACLVLMFRSHNWILAGGGRPGISDFLEVWVAGRTALHGAAAAAYDPVLHHAAEVAAAGHPFAKYLWWQYPPLFLLVASGLALMPYVAAFVGWLAATSVPFAATTGAIARSRVAALVALASPAAFVDCLAGQNGFLVAALIGATLVFLERRPLLSGVFLGLLAFKPQYGILFPLALAAGGYWRAFLSAAATTIVGVLVSAGVFGLETYRAFFRFLPLASQAILAHGANGWNNIESVYGLMRWLGYDNAMGWFAQVSMTGASGAALWILWRRRLPFELKAAALSLSALLATPYLYVYDYLVLVVPLAFLYRLRPFATVEILAIVVAQVSIGAFLFFPTPIGLVALAITAALIGKRVLEAVAAANSDDMGQAGAQAQQFSPPPPPGRRPYTA